MKLVAEIKRVAVPGINRIFAGYSPSGEQRLEDMPEAVRVEIEIGDDGTCMMYRYGMGDMFCGDTWHETLEDAKMNGAFEYSLGEADWKEEPGLERPG